MKKTVIYAVIMLIVCLCLKLDGGTLFKKGENHTFYYFSSAIGSSTDLLCRAENKSDLDLEFGFALGKKNGECADMTTENIQKTILELKAKKVFSESGDNFENVYYYSPKIPYHVTIKGKKVNLHVSYGNSPEGKAKIAAPINYGGY